VVLIFLAVGAMIIILLVLIAIEIEKIRIEIESHKKTIDKSKPKI
jgi:hypothetical protein